MPSPDQEQLMALADLDVPSSDIALPREVLLLLDEADRRIECFQRTSHVPGFVPSDFPGVYRVLRALAELGVSSRGFCEWGSGFGVAVCLAGILEFDALGVEIEEDLVDAARQLAEDFSVPVEFLHGSFIPPDFDMGDRANGSFSWLVTEEHGTCQEQCIPSDEFGVIFAYPWPDEEDVIAELFERYAEKRALLLTYHGSNEFRLRSKTAVSHKKPSR